MSMIRILTVRMGWIYAPDDEEGESWTLKKRRDTLGRVGLDVTKIDDEEMRRGCVLGMSDDQFIELVIAGEKEMSIIATAIIEPEF